MSESVSMPIPAVYDHVGGLAATRIQKGYLKPAVTRGNGVRNALWYTSKNHPRQCFFHEHEHEGSVPGITDRGTVPLEFLTKVFKFVVSVRPGSLEVSVCPVP